MVGAVQTRSVLIEPAACPGRDVKCEVVGVSPLLRQLLAAAADDPSVHNLAGRDGMVMNLLLAEISIAHLIPLAVPFPAHNTIAQLCHVFLTLPDVNSTTHGWADLMGMN